MEATSRMKMQTKNWPWDFQQILLDLLDNAVYQLSRTRQVDSFVDLPEYVDVEFLPIEPHFQETIELIECWQWDDFDRAREFAEAYQRGDEFPPLLVDTRGGLLRDARRTS